LFSRNPWKTLVSGLTSFSFAPIYFWALAGVGGALLAMVLLLTGLIAALSHAGIGGALAMLGLATFFWATLLAAISTVGIYVIRIYKDARQRPQYIVESTIGFE
jgi:hypothetical protein